MKILFVTLCALEVNTSVTKSNYGLLRGLLGLKHDVTIIMPEISSSLSYYDSVYLLHDVKVVRIKNSRLGSKVASMSDSNSYFKRLLIGLVRRFYTKFNLFDRSKELIAAAAKMPIYEDYFDLVISTSDPKTSHLFVDNLIKHGLKYGKWIQHWGDPLSGDISKTTFYPKFYINFIERKILTRADKVIYVSPFTANVQKKNHKTFANKIVFVPLACDENDNNNINKEKNKDIINAVYLGDYSSHIRNIIPLYNAIKGLPNVHLVIAGGTDLNLKECDNIKIYPRVKQDKVRELEDSADIIVSVGNLRGTQIPGKIYYVASTQKSILVTIDGENSSKMEKYLESYNRFDICMNDEDSITKKLCEIISIPNRCFLTPQRLLPQNVAQQIIDIKY